MTIFLLISASCAGKQEKVKEIGPKSVYRITLSDSFSKVSSKLWTLAKIEALGARRMPSSYFDRAMKYNGTEFEAISLLKLIEQFQLKNGQDAILLNCFDDYQGLLSLSDIHKYDLHLAIKIKVSLGSSKPDWLNPLLVLVPDGKHPPFEERFLTANIRELQFVKLSDYYMPLKKLADISSEAGQGFAVYKNNCLFCHSLKGRGGNKGAHLLDQYSFSKLEGKEKFLNDFKSFHDKSNLDKQDIEQFITGNQLKTVISFLLALIKDREN
tara:strand:- start:248 stop:1054 length:807 start_codon:yes stop_codon:yes gene_type:complete